MRLRRQKAQLRVNQRADLAASTREADVTARVGGVLMRALRTPGPAVSALRVGLVCVCAKGACQKDPLFPCTCVTSNV